MKKFLIPLVIIITFLIGILATRFFIGGSEDAWICTNGQWVKHGSPSTSQPQSACGQPQTSKTPENTPTINKTNIAPSVNEAMIQALSQKYNRPANSISVTTTINTGSFAKGSVNFTGEGGAIWFAAKVKDKWQLVNDGQGPMDCSLVNQYNFPTTLIPSCLDNNKNLIQR